MERTRPSVEAQLAALVTEGPAAVDASVPLDVLIAGCRQYVLERATERARKRVRKVERATPLPRAAMSDLAARISDTARAVAPYRGREWPEALRAQYVVLPGGRRETWGRMSTGQHLARAAWLEQHAAEEVRTAADHHAAARDIEEGRASCLDDLARR